MNDRRAVSRARDALAATMVTGVALLVVQVWGADPAAAHAALVGVVPADGSTVQKAPTTVTLSFNENIRTPSVVIVDGPDGTRVDQGSTAVVNNTAAVRVQIREPGPYTVAYRVISADGHPVSARTGFTYRGPGGSGSAIRPSETSAQTGGQTGGQTGDQAGDGTRLVLAAAAAALVLAGGLLLTGRVRRSKERR